MLLTLPHYYDNSGQTCTFIIIINPLTARVVGAPQMVLQPVSSISPCSPLLSGTCRTPGLSIPWCCLPTSSSFCRVFFPLSLCFARWFLARPDEPETRPYHCSMRLFTIVRRTSWGSTFFPLGVAIVSIQAILLLLDGICISPEPAISVKAFSCWKVNVDLY